MNIQKINDLLGQVRVKLESLDPQAQDEALVTINGNASHGKAVAMANSRVANLVSKAQAGNKYHPKATSASGKKSK